MVNTSDTKDGLLSAYKAAPYNCTPIYPFILRAQGGSSIAPLFGSPNSGGPTWIVTPNRKYSSTNYSESTLKTNIQNALNQKKALTVNSGKGAGSFLEGTKVTITANPPAAGKVFDKWTGTTTGLSSATSATAVFTMPNAAITLTATYKSATDIQLLHNGGGLLNGIIAGARIVGGEFRFVKGSAGNISMDLCSPAGKVLMSRSGYFTAGTHALSLDGVSLSSGVYLLKVRGNDCVENQQIIVR